MGFAVLLIGLVLVVAAVRNSQADLFKELAADVPAFGVWAAAIIAIGAIGFVPGLKPISKGLLFLVILVILVNNYKNIESGLRGAWSNASASDGTSSSTASNQSATSNALQNGLSSVDPGIGELYGIVTGNGL